MKKFLIFDYKTTERYRRTQNYLTFLFELLNDKIHGSFLLNNITFKINNYNTRNNKICYIIIFRNICHVISWTYCLSCEYIVSYWKYNAYNLDFYFYFLNIM